MAALTLLFVLLALVGALCAGVYAFALARRGRRTFGGQDVPSWPRFHVRYYTFAVLFMAFDMEMAYAPTGDIATTDLLLAPAHVPDELASAVNEIWGRPPHGRS